AQQAADKASQEAADKASQQAADKASQEAADKASQEAADKASQEAADKASQEAADKASQEAADKTSQEAADKASQEAADKAAQEAADKAAREAADKAAQQAADKASQQAATKAATEEASEQATTKTAEKTGHQTDKQTAHHSDLKKKISAAKTRRTLDILDSAIDRHREFKGIYDNNGALAVNDEILVLASKTARFNAKEQGYHVSGRRYLKGLGMVLTRVEAPKGTKLPKSATELSGDMKNAKVDLNYLFLPATGSVSSADTAYSVADFASKENLNLRETPGIRLGLIDTMVDRSHPSLRGKAITAEDFIPYDMERPEGHGTAIASLLVGNEPSVFRGLVPGAKLSAASVFFKLPSGKVAATTESLILALDWLVRQKVRVINMSLSGPPNSLLAMAIRRVAEKGIITVAAVGNAGPVAAPLFPAAYPDVVAVTAVNKNHHVYLRANRGSYIIFSAPGVNIVAAHYGGGYRAVTGTSIAAPFVSAILANEANANKSLNQEQLVKILEKNTLDLGTSGFDDTYGYGLIQTLPPAD
ncbi:MAG: S8 family serine peptidase, partial [Alphaproteobacteria bacterium]|nr:S8 family serine peptidase [Alphaproteobacteria bacterium]